MAISPLYIGNDLDLTATGMSIASTGAYLNAATVTWSLTDAEGTEFGTGTLSYVADSDGDYAGVVESTVTSELEDGGEYVLTVTFAEGSYNAAWQYKIFACYRQ